jgi:hypothetical protein
MSSDELCWVQDVLDLIEKKPLGVLDSLDEACRFPTATGATFAEKMYDNKDIMGHKRFEKPKRSNTAFIIDHYAGKVEYQVGSPSFSTEAVVFDGGSCPCALFVRALASCSGDH